jgi:hypothetical protein
VSLLFLLLRDSTFEPFTKRLSTKPVSLVLATGIRSNVIY